MLAVAATLATAACTGGRDPAPPVSTPKDVTVTLGSPSSVPAMVEGKDYRVDQEIRSDVGGRSASYYDVRRGSAYAVQYPSSGSEDSARAAPANRLFAVDLATGTKKLVHQPERPTDGPTSPT